MATNFPTSLDAYSNPAPTDDVSIVVHSTQHANHNDSIEAIEAKLGITNSADTASIDYLLKSTSSVSPGHKHAATEIADGSVSNAEFQYLGSVTSDIQTQLNAKASSAGALTQFVGNGNWKVWYSDGSGDVTELALGASGTFLKSNGTTSAPTFATPTASVSIGDTITSATEGSILFAGVSGVLAQDNTNLFWNNTTNSLGISDTTPFAKFSVSTSSPTRIGSIIRAFTTNSAGAQPDSISGLQLWLKADAIVGLSDGDLVATWEDSSSNNNDATQSTGGLKPVYKTNQVNGKAVVRFDNSDDAMATPLSISAVPFTIFAVYRTNDVTVRNARAVAGSNNWLLGPYGGVYLFFNGASVNNSTALGYNQTKIHVATQATGDAEGFLNGTSTGTNANNNAPGTIGLGAYTHGQPLSGDIMEVIIYDSSLSDADRISVEQYLATKYGVVIPSSTAQTSNLQEWRASDDAPVVIIDANGQLGVNTASPLARLHVDNGLTYLRSSDNTAATNILSAYAANLTQGIGIGYGEVRALGSDQQIIISSTGSGNVRIVAGSSGDIVGIGSLGINNFPTAYGDFPASTTSRASFRIRDGTAPSSPNDGDIWQDGTHIYCRIGGATKQLD